MLSKSTLLLISLVLCSATAQAGIAVTYSTHDEPHFAIEVPDSWQVNVGSDTDASQLPEGELPPPRVITLMPDDDSTLWFGVWVPVYLHSLDAAQEYLSSLDEFLVDNPVLKKSDNVNLNSMPARYFTGDGTKEGNPMNFFVMLFEISDESVGIAIYIGTPETTQKHLDTLRGMMKSISPAGE